MKIIPSRHGHRLYVDDADYEAVVAAGPWQVKVKSRHCVYATRHVRKADGTRTKQFLHTFLTGWPLVDHANGNGLDNRRANLRPATPAQNLANARPRGGASSFKGVTWRADRRQWRARITASGRRHQLGYFKTEVAAALAYDVAARTMFGEFARTNFPA